MTSNSLIFIALGCLTVVYANPLNRYLMDMMSYGMDPMSKSLLRSPMFSEMLDMDTGTGSGSSGYGGFGSSGFGSYGYSPYGLGSFGYGPYGLSSGGTAGQNVNGYGYYSNHFPITNTVSYPKTQTQATSSQQSTWSQSSSPASIPPASMSAFDTTNLVQPNSISTGSNPYNAVSNKELLTSQSATIGTQSNPAAATGVGSGAIGTGATGGGPMGMGNVPIMRQYNPMSFLRNLFFMNAMGMDFF